LFKINPSTFAARFAILLFCIMEDLSSPSSIAVAIPEKKRSFLRISWKIFKWSLITTAFLVGLATALLFIYEDEIKDLAVTELNKRLNAEVKIDPKNIDFTIFSSFPDAGVEFKHAVVMEALKKKDRDTIIDAGQISLRFNVMDLFHEKYEIKKLVIADTKIDFLTDKNGRHNFIFWKETDEKESTPSTGKEINFKLERIDFKNVEFAYKNKKEFIKIHCNTEETTLSGAFSATDYLLNSNGKFFFKELVLYKRSLLKNKNITFETTAAVKGKDWEMKETSVAVNQLHLSANGGIWKKDSIISCDLQLAGKDLDVKSALSILPESQQEKIKDYESEGNFYFNAGLKGNLGDFNKLSADFNFGVKNAKVKHIPSGSALSNVNLKGNYSKAIDGKDVLTLKEINAAMNSNTISGECTLRDLADPLLELNANINAELAELIKFYPIDTVQSISGKVNLHAQIEGKLSDLKSNYAEQKSQAKGEASIENLEVLFKHSVKPLKIKSGELAIVQNDLSLKNVIITPGESEIALNGELNNFFAWMLKENEPLNINGSAKSEEIKIDQLMTMFAGNETPAPGAATSSKENSLSISDKFILDFNVEVGKASWSKFNAENIRGNVRVKDGKLFAEDLEFKAFDGDVSFSGCAANLGGKIIFKGSSELVQVNINKLFYQLNNFGQEVIQDKQLRGIATASIAFSTLFNKDYSPELNSIVASSDILIERGELLDYKTLEALSDYVALSELRKIKFNTLKTHVDIKDQIIKIGKTEINNTAMNLTFFGTHTFNNDIDYHLSILMTELMAKKPGKSKELDEELRLVENDPENKRTVFIRMTGNIDNIKFQYDRKAAKEKLKDDIKNEKKNLKSILKEEFGLFKKDSTLNKDDPDKRKKADQKFKIQSGKPDDQKIKDEDDDF
jgi:hypothetical protein